MAFVWFSWREGFAFHLAEFLGGRERGRERESVLQAVLICVLCEGDTDAFLSESDAGTTEVGSSCAFDNEIEVKVHEGRFV